MTLAPTILSRVARFPTWLPQATAWCQAKPPQRLSQVGQPFLPRWPSRLERPQANHQPLVAQLRRLEYHLPQQVLNVSSRNEART